MPTPSRVRTLYYCRTRPSSFVSRFMKSSFTPFRLLGVVALLGIFTPIARAQLVLNLNTDTQMLWFTGTSSAGASEVANLLDTAAWQTGTGTQDNQLVVLGALQSDGLVGISAATLETDSSSSLVALVLRFTSAVGSATISGTGSGNAVSYSSIGASAISNLEAATTLALSIGTGFGDINVSAMSAVPEPSTYASLIGSLALIGVALRRPRRRTALLAS